MINWLLMVTFVWCVMSVNVKVSEEIVALAREQSKIFHRTIGGQIDYWVSVGRLAETHPGLTFDHLQKLMKANQLGQAFKNKKKGLFQAVSLDTKNYHFDREDANAR